MALTQEDGSQGNLAENTKKTRQPPTQSIQVLRRFVGGTVGGVLQAACAHPFDTIKSRIQSGLTPSMSVGVKTLYQAEGFRGFYRGVTPPLIVNGTYNAVLFSVNHYMTGLVTPADQKKGEPLAMWRIALAATMTAPFAIAVITPKEVVKVRMQTQSHGEFTGAFDCCKKLIKAGGITALGRGYSATLCSRLVGLPWYFIGYEWAKRSLSQDPEGEPAPTYVEPLSGAVAGVTFWSVCYPLDYIKTRVQSSPQSGLQVAKSVYAEAGIKGFYRGFTPCICRAVPANGSVWFGMDQTANFMERNGW